MSTVVSRAVTVLLLILGAQAMPVMAWSDADEERFRALGEELRCLVCQNQSIADSAAPLAADLRAQLREMIESGQTDAQIREYMTQRYGDFVLYRPPLRTRTLALWFGPFGLLLVGIVLVFRSRKRSDETASAATPVDEAKLRKILDDTK